MGKPHAASPLELQHVCSHHEKLMHLFNTWRYYWHGACFHIHIHIAHSVLLLINTRAIRDVLQSRRARYQTFLRRKSPRPRRAQSRHETRGIKNNSLVCKSCGKLLAAHTHTHTRALSRTQEKQGKRARAYISLTCAARCVFCRFAPRRRAAHKKRQKN
jgi:hypothetical protein